MPNIGYGRMFNSLLEELSKRVTIDQHAEHAVWALQPNMVKGWFKGQKKTVLTMWETDTLPNKFKDYLPQFDTVIVPCLHNMELFEPHHPNVHVIPLGVDRSVWYPRERVSDGKFRIFAGGSEWYRKGLDVIVEVFTSMKLPDCELHLKIPPPHLGAPEVMDWPNVVMHTEWMSLEEEVDLVTSCDLFVSASRGEGFGLMPLQAMSAGVPTVLTDMTGHREFSDLAVHRVGGTLGPSRITNWETIGRWFEPNRDELADAIRDVYDNREKAKRLALKRAPETAAFNWATAADQFLQIVKPSDRMVEPVKVPAGEIEVPVRVNRRVVADIGRYHVDLVPGRVHHVFLNVRDVLAESGYLLEE